LTDNAQVKTAIRKLRRDKRLGEGPKICLLCGYADPISLISVNSAWLDSHKDLLPHSLFEKDHVVGRNHDPDFMAAICRNCHAEVTELRREAGISMRFEHDKDTREALRLEALALFHEDTALALRRWASEKRSAKEPT
jgi:hypothetical protein